MTTNKLSFAAIEFLRSMLAASGWSKAEQASTGIERIYWASKLVAEHLPEKEGTDPIISVDLPDKSLPTIKFCIGWFMKEGRTPANIPMLELITTFELHKE